MDDILDEQLKQEELFERIPLMIYLFMVAVFIFILGSVVFMQFGAYGKDIQNIGILCLLITGVLSFKIFKEQKDRYLNFYWGLFLFTSFSTIAIQFGAYESPIRELLYVGEQCLIPAVLLSLMRYFILRRPQKTFLNIMIYPLLLTTPMWMASRVCRITWWPYASELLVIGALVFLGGTSIMTILKLRKENPALRVLNLWIIAMTNLFVFGLLFKIQSWPNASELLITSFLGGSLGFMLKFIQQQAKQKKQVTQP